MAGLSHGEVTFQAMVVSGDSLTVSIAGRREPRGTITAMAFIPDLSTNCYFATGPQLRAVGWLEAGQAFQTGPVVPELLPTLRVHLKDPFGVVDYMGFHICTLCPARTGPHGNGELLVPAKTVCYVAPQLIVHYVEVHRYCPPDEFVEALLTCPPQHSDGYMELIRPFLDELEGNS